MSFNKKFVLPVAAAMLMASCGGSSGTGLSTSQQPSASGLSSQQSSASPSSSAQSHKEDHVIDTPVEITFWSTFNDEYQGTINSIIEEFKKVEPNVTVKNVKESGSYTDLKDKVVDNLAAGMHPDMFVGYPDSVQELMQYNAVVNLDPYINNPVYGWTQEDKEDIIEAYLEEGESYPVPGVWSVPAAKSTEAMYYNRDVLLNLDLSAQDPTINDGTPLTEAYLNNLTWEELFDHLCPAIVAKNELLPADQKILKSNENYTTTVFGYDSDDNLFITLAEQYGYGYTSVDQVTGEGSIDFVNDGMKSLVKKFRSEHYNEGIPHFFTKGSNNNNYTNYTFTASCSLFSVGSTGGSGYQVSPDFDTGVAKIPHAAGKDAKVINQGPSIAVLNHKDDNRALASWLFYKFFTNEKNAAVWAINSGYSPIRYSTLDSAEYAEYSTLTGKQARSKEIVKARVAQYVTTVSRDLYSSPVFKGSAEARTQVGSLMIQSLSAETLTDAQLDKLFSDAENNVKKKM